MPKKATGQGKGSKDWQPPKFYLNGTPIDKIPQDALDVMSERLSRVVSQYFRDHPEEYERFLEGRKQNAQEAPT